MMKKLGSRFTLKRRDSNKDPGGAGEDAIEELIDDDYQVLTTARPRDGRTLTSSNSNSTARPSSIYGDLTLVRCILLNLCFLTCNS